MTKNVVHMAAEYEWAKLLGKVAGHVEFGINVFEDNQITFNPFAEYIVSNIHVLGVGSWLLDVCHREVFSLANPACYTKWTLGGPSRFPLGN